MQDGPREPVGNEQQKVGSGVFLETATNEDHVCAHDADASTLVWLVFCSGTCAGASLPPDGNGAGGSAVRA